MMTNAGVKQSNRANLMRILSIISLISVTSLWAQTVPNFEVAHVHRSDRAMNPFTFVSGGVLRGERYDLRKATMLDLIRIACNVDPDTVVGGPNWERAVRR
jgi:hypothetical protein